MAHFTCKTKIKTAVFTRRGVRWVKSDTKSFGKMVIRSFWEIDLCDFGETFVLLLWGGCRTCGGVNWEFGIPVHCFVKYFIKHFAEFPKIIYYIILIGKKRANFDTTLNFATHFWFAVFPKDIRTHKRSFIVCVLC